MIFTLLYFILALFLLIVVHEFGHFIVARCCGVKVLRFSFGFGKVIARWYDKRGTEFAWSVLPLGGYVKMLDEAEGEVPKNELHLAFNNKPVWSRIAIILAGPLFNFIFAFFVLWLILIIGIKSLAPMIDEVRPGSMAAVAGLKAKHEIVSLDGKQISSWRDFQYALLPLLGSGESIVIKAKSLEDGKENIITLPLANWQMDSKNPDVLKSFGITPFVPKIPPIVGEVVDNSPAQVIGLQKEDIVTSVDGLVVDDWLVLVDYVKKQPDKTINLVVKRQGTIKKIVGQVGNAVNNGQTEGFLGVRSKQVDWPAGWLRTHRETPLQAIGSALTQTIDLTSTTFTLIGRLIVGKLPLQSISGPLGIAQGAGEAARSGLPYFLSFLALVSISLGVLNLLPIPMLDGGHLLYCVIEIIRRRPLSEQAKTVGVYFGLVLLIALTVLGLNNDITRLVG